MPYVGITPLQWFNSFGSVTLVQLRISSKNVRMPTVILPVRARHQISHGWLEMMNSFSFSSLSEQLKRRCSHVAGLQCRGLQFSLGRNT